MKKKYSLKSKVEFERILKKGIKIKTNYYIFSYQVSDCFLLGISVPKKLGNSVFRNKQKRQIKNIVAELNVYEKVLKKMTLIVSYNFVNRTFQEKKNILKNLFFKL